MGESVVVTNGCADNMSGTSEVPQLADPLCATRKSAEVGHKRPCGRRRYLPLRNEIMCTGGGRLLGWETIPIRFRWPLEVAN